MLWPELSNLIILDHNSQNLPASYANNNKNKKAKIPSSRFSVGHGRRPPVLAQVIPLKLTAET